MEKFFERHKYQNHNQAQVVLGRTRMTKKELLNFPVPRDTRTIQLHSQKIPLRVIQWLKDYDKQRSICQWVYFTSCGYPSRLSPEIAGKIAHCPVFP